MKKGNKVEDDPAWMVVVVVLVAVVDVRPWSSKHLGTGRTGIEDDRRIVIERKMASI